MQYALHKGPKAIIDGAYKYLYHVRNQTLSLDFNEKVPYYNLAK